MPVSELFMYSALLPSRLQHAAKGVGVATIIVVAVVHVGERLEHLTL